MNDSKVTDIIDTIFKGLRVIGVAALVGEVAKNVLNK